MCENNMRVFEGGGAVAPFDVEASAGFDVEFEVGKAEWCTGPALVAGGVSGPFEEGSVYCECARAGVVSAEADSDTA